MRISNTAGCYVNEHDVFDAVCSAKKQEMLQNQNVPTVLIKKGREIVPYKNDKIFRKPFELNSEVNLQALNNNQWMETRFNSIKLNIGDPYTAYGFAVQSTENKNVAFYIADKTRMQELREMLVSPIEEIKMSALQEIQEPKGTLIGKFLSSSPITLPIKSHIQAFIEPNTPIVLHARAGIQLEKTAINNQVQIAIRRAA